VKSSGPGLLVSVRNAAEAAAALEGGADIIDVKEPSRGTLGRADDSIIAEIVRLVSKRRLVSAALGEWTEPAVAIPHDELAFVKWGLAGWRGRDWRQSLAQVMTYPCHSPRPVLVAYADWEQADSPPVDEIAEGARHWHCGLLLDTFRKEPGLTLLDWLSIKEIEDLCRQCRQAEVPIALAGSLGPEQIAALRTARPDWFAVRGAACETSNRNASIQAGKVRELAELLKTTPVCSA
jgi:(5-formylfuran-3-yl)methyl phosphate synthase